MKDTSSPSLFELNLPEGLPSLRGRVPLTMSAEAFEARFLATRAELPEEVTVLPLFDTNAYKESLATEIFVAPDGNDAAAGTEQAPVATLKEALARVAGKGGATITMRGGLYSFREAARLSAEHSGTGEKPLIVRAYPGETPILTANKAISSRREVWAHVDPATDPVAARIPKEAQARVLVTDIAAHGLVADDMAEITIHGAPRLFVDGEEYVLARYPNKAATVHELLYFTKALDTGTVTQRDGSDLYWTWADRADRDFGGDRFHTVGWQFRLPNAKDNLENAQGSVRPDPEAEERSQFLLSWVNTGNVWFFGSIFEGWEHGYHRLAAVAEGRDWSHYAEGDTEKKTPLLGAFEPNPEGPYTYEGEKGYFSLKSTSFGIHGCKHSTNSPAGRNTYFLFNAIEALDEPGEWFYDEDTGKLYIIPRDEESFYGAAVSYSGKAEITPVVANGLSHAILDGLTLDGSNDGGLLLSGCYDVVIQRLVARNTKMPCLSIASCRHTAVIHSDFSAAYESMVVVASKEQGQSLTPSDNLVQNCFFHNAKPTFQYAVALGDCRAVISHNYFRNCCMSASNAWECITEYNRFDGGNEDVVDGGMYYAAGEGGRNNHIRYNLFHMFNETHQAVYNDGMCSGIYTYGNIVSTLGSKANGHSGWYSSSGMGNVCFGNLMIFRDPWEVISAESVAGDEDDKVSVGIGDRISQSALFYFFAGKEHAAANNRAYRYVAEGREESLAMDYAPETREFLMTQSLAGHWWEGCKERELNRYLVEEGHAARCERDPAYVNHLYGTRLVLDALANSDYLIKYFYLPARWTGKTFTSSAAPAGTELLIPEYTYLADDYSPVTVPTHTVTVPESGEVTLAYEEIGAMERLRRAPAFCVIKNNVFLGGTPLMDEARKNRVGDTDVYATVIDSNRFLGYFDESAQEWKRRSTEGYFESTLEANNLFRFDFGDIVTDARGFDYTVREDARAEIVATLEPTEAERVLALDQTKAGPTYGFDYAALGPVQSRR